MKKEEYQIFLSRQFRTLRKLSNELEQKPIGDLEYAWKGILHEIDKLKKQIRCCHTHSFLEEKEIAAKVFKLLIFFKCYVLRKKINEKNIQKTISETEDWVKKVTKTKGRAYASGGEVDYEIFGNFIRVASDIELSAPKVWFVYFAKHRDSVTSYVNGFYKDSEPIEGRINDMIAYVLLLSGYYADQSKQVA